MQFCGMQDQVSSVHLANNKLYVAVTTLSGIDFKHGWPLGISRGVFSVCCNVMLIQHLMLFMHTGKNGSQCPFDQKAIDCIKEWRDSIDKSLSRPRTVKRDHNKLSWQRLTCYSPSYNQPKLVCLPSHWFGKNDGNAVDSCQAACANLVFDGEPDTFGFVKLNDGRVYHYFEKKKMLTSILLMHNI